MQPEQLSAHHRAVFFQQLATQGTGEGQWDQVFRLLEQGQDAARRAQLQDLEAQFQGGRNALMTALRETDKFLDWELELIEVGMASANLRAVYRRLSEHYLLVQQFARDLRAHVKLPIGLVLAAGIVLPLAAFWDRQIGIPAALFLLLLPALLLCALWLGAQRLLRLAQDGRLPRWAVDLIYRAPGLGSVLGMYQVYHYFANLALCMGGGATLNQALPLAARCLPYSPYRRRFEAVHTAVAKGAKMSEALRDSGILQGLTLAPIGLGASAQDAQETLANAARAAFMERMNYWGRWLPQFGLALVPLILTINLLVIL